MPVRRLSHVGIFELVLKYSVAQVRSSQHTCDAQSAIRLSAKRRAVASARDSWLPGASAARSAPGRRDESSRAARSMAAASLPAGITAAGCRVEAY